MTRPSTTTTASLASLPGAHDAFALLSGLLVALAVLASPLAAALVAGLVVGWAAL